MTEKERQILEMQAPSTRKCLERPPELDLVWLRREIPKESQILKEDGSVNINVRTMYGADGQLLPDVVAANKARDFAGQEFESGRATYLKAKLAAGNAHKKLADQLDTEHVMPSSEKRERAIEAFMKSRTLESIKSAFKALFEGAMKTTQTAEHAITQRMRDTVKRWKNEE